MSTFKQMWELTLSRVGDETYFEHGTPSLASLARIKSEVNLAYRDAMNVLKRSGIYPLWYSSDIVVAAGTREVNLAAVLLDPTEEPPATALTPRAIMFVGQYPSQDTAQEPYPVRWPWGGDRRRARVFGSADGASQLCPEMFLRGRYVLGYVRTPTADQTLNVIWSPVCETMVADDDVPLQLPEEYHEYPSQLAAYNLLGGEDGKTSAIAGRLGMLLEQLEDADESINQFPTYVAGQWSQRSRHGTTSLI